MSETPAFGLCSWPEKETHKERLYQLADGRWACAICRPPIGDR